MPPLIVAHHAELRPQDGLDIDWVNWLNLNAVGRLVILTARHEHALVGYIGNSIAPSLLDRSRLECLIELYYLSPAYRFGWAPVEFFIANDRLLAELKVARTYITAVTSFQDARVRCILKRLGYAMTAEVWSK